MKVEQRKVWGPQVKQIALLASPIYTGQTQAEEKKTSKKRSQNQAGGLSCPVFWVNLSSCLKDVFFFAF